MVPAHPDRPGPQRRQLSGLEQVSGPSTSRLAASALPPTRRRAGGRPPPSPSGPSSRRSSSRKARAWPTTGPGRSPRRAMTSLPSRSGRMAASSSCGGSSAMRASSSSMRWARARALAALRVVQSQRVSSLSCVEQRAGVADVAADGAVGPAHLVGVEAQVELDQAAHRLDVLGRSSAGPASGRGSSGRRPPRGGGTDTAPRARTSGSWACRRRGTGRPGAGCRSGEVFSTTAMVWARTSLWRWIGSCSRARAGSSGRNSSARPVRTRNHSPSPGCSTTISLSSSSRIRSSETMSSRARSRIDGVDQLGVGDQAVAGDEPGGPHHAQRVVGEGLLGRQRGPQPARRPGRPTPSNGSIRSRSGRDRAMALTVKSRRDRSASIGVGEHDVGLAGVGVVGLGPVGGDLERRRTVLALQRRWCRTACPGSTPRRPSRPRWPRSRRGGRRW